MKTITLSTGQIATLKVLLRLANDQMKRDISEVFTRPGDLGNVANLESDIAANEEILRVLEGG